MDLANTRGLTILIAEDDDYNHQYLVKTFEKHGLNILRATNGKEAVTICRQRDDIRMILMDGMMPEMTGYDAAREIRKFRPDIPIVVLTAYVSTESIREAVLSGCNDYLAKPIGPEELNAILAKWLPKL